MGRIPDRPTWRMFIAMLAMYFATTAGGLIVVQSVQSSVSTNAENIEVIQDAQEQILVTQDRNRDVGYAIQSVNCSALVALGAPLPAPCNEGGVLEFYDPSDIEQTTAGIAQLSFFAVQLCELLGRTGEVPEECASFIE